MLAANLEQRVARLLPCDPRVRSAIEEVARASEARFTALEANWQEIAQRSQEQTESTPQADDRDGGTLGRTGRPTAADSWEQEQVSLSAQTSELRESARQASVAFRGGARSQRHFSKRRRPLPNRRPLASKAPRSWRPA